MIGELLLALAITFAAQNAVLWARASRFIAFPAEGGRWIRSIAIAAAQAVMSRR